MSLSLLKSFHQYCFYIFISGFVISFGMGFIVLIYYSAHQYDYILDTCNRIFIASSIFFGLMIITISIPYLYDKCKKCKKMSIRINSDQQIISYQRTPYEFFSIDNDNDEDEIIIDKNKMKKNMDNISVRSGDSFLITNF